jgi:prepilin-type N-terminal cleavage/methylation domain-containing protein
MNSYPTRAGGWQGAGEARGFTLIELLVVVAIISLLIGILIPSLSAARAHAKNVGTRSSLKAIGDGLEMFRSANEEEVRKTGGYPPSAAVDDPTEEDAQLIFGAQWLVRYLIGKDLKGYVPKRNVPPDVLDEGTQYYEQKHWYDTPDDSYVSSIGRAGPYIQPGGLTLVETEKLPGVRGSKTTAIDGVDVDTATYKQLVAVDAFGYPILYYAANARLAERKDVLVYLASFMGAKPGIYTMTDNALFTGAYSTSRLFDPWDFNLVLDGGADDLTNPYYKLCKFGEHDPPTADTLKTDEQDGKIYTFPYYILNKNAWQVSQKQTALPYRSDSYLLITAGRDGNFGTKDDVTNFE